MFAVVSHLKAHLGFVRQFLRAQSGAPVKFRARKTGRVCSKFVNPWSEFLYFLHYYRWIKSYTLLKLLYCYNNPFHPMVPRGS